MNYFEVIMKLIDNLSNHFDEVFHSAEIVIIDKEKFPAINSGNEWINLVPTDQKETIYIRRNGDDEVYEEQKLGSCTKAYRMRSALRLVFFSDHEKNPEEILFKLMQSVLIQATKIRSIIRDKWKLQKDESSGDYNFSAKTCYLAIDFYVFWDLRADICEQDFCAEIENPFCKHS